MSKLHLALIGLVALLTASPSWADGNVVFHLDFSDFADVSGNELPINVGDAVSLVPGGGPTLANGATLDSARWEGEEDETNQIILFDHALLDAVSVGAGSIVAWIKPDDGDEWNNIAKTPCEFNVEPCDEFGQYAGIEFQASGPHAGVFGAVQGWDTNVFGPDTPLGPGGETDTPSDEWTHAALTWNADGDHTIYVNGEPGEPVIGVGDFDFGENLTGDWTIGGDALGTNPENVDTSRTLRGELADFAIFDGELTQEEIMQIISSGVSPAGEPGDIDRDGDCDLDDIEALGAAIRANDQSTRLDLDGNGSVDAADRRFLVENIKNTYLGDSNLDGQFSSGDFVVVFTAAKYESGQSATYAEGDWNGDGFFNSGDFVTVFGDASYEKGPRPAPIPEPNCYVAAMLLVLCLFRKRGFAAR
ncbi:MAG: hypothetical protein KDB27_11790 [Planctomycetales bacterium]|nr:hypothetical protein [Planctomycetales bacterium]